VLHRGSLLLYGNLRNALKGVSRFPVFGHFGSSVVELFPSSTEEILEQRELAYPSEFVPHKQLPLTEYFLRIAEARRLRTASEVLGACTEFSWPTRGEN